MTREQRAAIVEAKERKMKEMRENPDARVDFLVRIDALRAVDREKYRKTLLSK